MYFYDGHMGSLFTSDYPLSYEETYCETCGDSDWLIGKADTIEEARELLKDITDRDLTPDEEGYEEYLDEGELICASTGGYDREYISKFLEESFA